MNLRICPKCEQRLKDAGIAIRYLETGIHRGLELNEQGYLTEECRRELAPELVSSFNKAQEAWDAFREHLIGHRLLERSAKTANPTT